MSAKGVDEEAWVSTQPDDTGGGGGGDAVWGGDATRGHRTSVSEAKQNKNKKKNLQGGVDRCVQWPASMNPEEGRGEVDAASSGWRYRQRAWGDDGT